MSEIAAAQRLSRPSPPRSRWPARTGADAARPLGPRTSRHAGLAELLRRLRTQRCLTQRGLADRAGISKESVYLYERGRKHPRASTLVLLARALQVPLVEFTKPPQDRP